MTDTSLDLEVSRLVAAPRARVWQAWSDPELLRQWWCPRPWTTQVKAFDFRAGGGFHTYMTGPDGGESDNPGCFLDIVPLERIVTTSVLGAGWRPIESWMAITAVFTFADEGTGTRYTARCMHLTREAARRHEEMGFFDGWGAATSQLEEVARAIGSH